MDRICGIYGKVSDNIIFGMLEQQKLKGSEKSFFWTSPDHKVQIGILQRSPVQNEKKTLTIAMNGDIFNTHKIKKKLDENIKYLTDNDAEVVLHLYEKEGPDCIGQLDGIFALALYDSEKGLMLARDRIGIKPLYYAKDDKNTLYFGSEIKSLMEIPNLDEIKEFPIGHYWFYPEPMKQYYKLPTPTNSITNEEKAIQRVEMLLKSSMKKRLVIDEPMGAFLSGGTDSCIIAAMANMMVPDSLKTFSVGMKDSPDLWMANKAAYILGTDHYEYVIPEDEILTELPKIIWKLESFDAALVRGSIATYFAARLAAKHVNVVLSGEGSDELFAGYHYLEKYQDNPEELNKELYFITNTLHNLALQRVDRMASAFGLEVRLPFLDPALIEYAFQLDIDLLFKDDQSKWIIREVTSRYLPKAFAWRTKEKFAIGTGIGEFLEKHANEQIPEREWKSIDINGRLCKSAEEALYWGIFKKKYKQEDVQNLVSHARSLNPGEVWEKRK